MVRNLDIGALRSLVAIADTDSVTKAAAQINLSQSAVSMQIKRLEETFDAKLLHREGRGVALTAVGEHLLSYARRMLVINDETWTQLTNDDYQGDVVFGVPVDDVLINMYQAPHRDSALIEKIADIVRDAFRRDLRIATAG